MSEKKDTFADINDLLVELHACFEAEIKRYRARPYKQKTAKESAIFSPSKTPRSTSALLARLLERGYQVRIIKPE